MLSSYSVNWLSFITDMLPVRRRLTVIKQYLFVLLKPLRDKHSELVTFGDARRTTVKHSGVTIELEARLNEFYGFAPGSIYIINNNIAVPRYFAFDLDDARNKFVYDVDSLQNQYVKGVDEFAVSEFDFTIYFPDEISPNMDQLRAIVNLYKTYGRTFNVVMYTP
jgi:hypothetical protein